MKPANSEIKKCQQDMLKIFAKKTKTFALAGGTALELYYLHHRFSADLDFFSPGYDFTEIEAIISAFKKELCSRVELEHEFITENHARIRIYSVYVKGFDRVVKIDFVEDVLFDKPAIKIFNRVPVYEAEYIYQQKIAAVTGTRVEIDSTGREIMRGRAEARDAFDIYILSKKIEPLAIFLRKVPRPFQRGMIHWYRTFSRQDLKLGLLDLDIYDKKFNARQMITYLENEINKFMKEEISE